MANNVRIYPPGEYGGGGGGGGGRYNAQQTTRELQAEIRELQAELERIKTEPKLVGTIVELRGGNMLVSFGPGNALYLHSIGGARVGDRVLCMRNSMQAVEVIKDPFPTGQIITVTSADGDVIEAELLGAPQVFRGQGKKIAKGERVVIDPSKSFVIGSLGMPATTYARPPTVSVTWDDIGGQEAAKDALREAIELPLSHPNLFAAYGKSPSKGVLLAGPTGLGKSICAKAAATSIARAHGEKASTGFIYVKGPELLSKYVGESEQAVRGLFIAARDHKAKHGYPALIFLDECDSLLGTRQNTQAFSISTTLVPQFLAEMDGFDDAAALFILATNRPDMLDPAVTREGRIDRKIMFERPSKEDAAKIAKIHLRGKPVAADMSTSKLARELCAALFADGRSTLDLGEGRSVQLRDHVSGSLIAGIVDKAATRAILRDIATGRREVSGITKEDVVHAVELVQHELRVTDQREVIEEVVRRQLGQRSEGREAHNEARQLPSEVQAAAERRLEGGSSAERSPDGFSSAGASLQGPDGPASSEVAP
jgi:proteasome-associated ATPase